MAMRALLRSAVVARAWCPRSAAAVGVPQFSPEYQSDLTSSSIASSSSSSALSESLRSLRFSSSISSSSLSVSEILRSFSNSPSSSSVASGALQIPAVVSSVFISASAVAPLSSYSGGLHPSTIRSLVDLRIRRVYGGAQQLGGESPGLSASMQQRRSLSKLKKYKMKAYSSYKERFKLMADGTYKRWRSGTRHNAHSKTAKQRRQLRRPSIAPAALAKVMKKLHFVR